MSDVRPATRHEAAVLRAWADVAVLAPVPVPADAAPLAGTPTRAGRVHVAALPAAVVQGWLRAAVPGADGPAWTGQVARACFDLDDTGSPVPGTLLVTPLLDLAHALYAKSAGVALHAELVDAALDQVAALGESLERVYARLSATGDLARTLDGLARAAPRVQHRTAGGTGTPVDLLGPAGPLPAVALVPAELYDAAEGGVAPALAHLLAGRPGSRPVRRTDVGTVAGLAELLSPDDLPRAAPAADPLPVQVAVTALLRDRAPLTTVVGTDPARAGAVLDGLVAGLALERADALVAGGTPVAALEPDGVVGTVAGRELVVLAPAGAPGTAGAPRLGEVLTQLRAGRGLDLAAVTPGEWGRRRHTFALAEQAVREAVDVRAAATTARWELADREQDEVDATDRLGRADADFAGAQQAVLAAELAEAEGDAAVTAAEQALADVDATEPPRRAVLRRRQFSADRLAAASALDQAREASDTAHEAHTAARTALQQCLAARLAAQQAREAAAAAVTAARARTRPEDTTVVDDTWWERDDDERRAGTAWVDDELAVLRADLAAAATRLVDVAVRVLAPRLRERLLGDVPRDAGFWQALGLVHPALRLDPADALGVLGAAPVDTVGWLALPAAERLEPGVAAALLRHVRHAVVLGRPDGAGPPPALPLPLVAHLLTRHGLPGSWAEVGLLALARTTATVGADVDGVWQGIPVDAP